MDNLKRKRSKKAGIKPVEAITESQPSPVQHSFTSPVSILLNQARSEEHVQSSLPSNEGRSNETNVNSDSFEREELNQLEEIEFNEMDEVESQNSLTSLQENKETKKRSKMNHLKKTIKEQSDQLQNRKKY